MLQVYLSGCCICLTHMLQVFYLDVAYVRNDFQVVSGVFASISDVYCKYFVACVLFGCYKNRSRCCTYYEQARKVGGGGGGPMARNRGAARRRKDEGTATATATVSLPATPRGAEEIDVSYPSIASSSEVSFPVIPGVACILDASDRTRSRFLTHRCI